MDMNQSPTFGWLVHCFTRDIAADKSSGESRQFVNTRHFAVWKRGRINYYNLCARFSASLFVCRDEQGSGKFRWSILIIWTRKLVIFAFVLAKFIDVQWWYDHRCHHHARSDNSRTWPQRAWLPGPTIVGPGALRVKGGSKLLFLP